MLKINKIWLFCLIGLIVTACSISYKFNGASIDYTKVKTITIKDFPNQVDKIVDASISVNGIGCNATHIPNFVLTLELYIFTKLCVKFQTHVLPIEFTVGLIVNEFLMTIFQILESIVVAIRITAAEPPGIDSPLTPVSVKSISPIAVGYVFIGMFILPLLH